MEEIPAIALDHEKVFLSLMGGPPCKCSIFCQYTLDGSSGTSAGAGTTSGRARGGWACICGASFTHLKHTGVRSFYFFISRVFRVAIYVLQILFA